MHQKKKLAFDIFLIDFWWIIEWLFSYFVMTGIMCKTRFWTTVNVVWTIVAFVQTCESLVSDVRTIPKSKTNTNIIFSWVMSWPCICNAFVVVLYYGKTVVVCSCIDFFLTFWNLVNNLNSFWCSVRYLARTRTVWPGQGPSGRDRYQTHLSSTQ